MTTFAPPRMGGWWVARVTPLIEVRHRGRIAGTAVMMTVQIFLYVLLWRALYATTASSAGLTMNQAVTYAVLAVLLGQTRWSQRGFSRDSVLAHVRDGSIAYWFVRPMSPRRYYFRRSLGEAGYAALWGLAGYVACRLCGVVDAPAGAAVGLASAVSVILGQVILYYLILSLDLFCFWAIANNSAVRIFYFLQTLLAGGFVPLWFFPSWLISLSMALPFQAILNVPLSIYVGRIEPRQIPVNLTIQFAWILTLVVTTRLLWRRAAGHVTVQGG
jgi:viologen exporter family transport system permease protein